jgi:flagellar assembly protein FliH
LSSLLKKEADAGVTVFGFPVIQHQENQMMNQPLRDESIESEVEDSEPEEVQIDVEEVFRKRLLELERRGQEIEKEAYGKGFAQGERDGLEYGQKSVQIVKAQLEGIAKNLEELPGKIQMDYRNWLVQTSIRLARQIVQQELRMSPEVVADTVGDLLAEAEESSTMTVYLNPQDIEFIEKRADLDLKANGKHFTVKSDRNLERGGCRLESDIQLLDASIETRFNNLEKLLRSSLDTQGHPMDSSQEDTVSAGIKQNG